MPTIRTWTGREAMLLRDALGVDYRKFARLVGVHESTVREWQKRDATIAIKPVHWPLLAAVLEDIPPDRQARFTAGIPAVSVPPTVQPIPIDRWTGAEAALFVQAMQMTVRDSAAHLGVDPTTITRWRRQGTRTELSSATQKLLRTALRRAGIATRSRFYTAVAEHRARTAAPQKPDRTATHTTVAHCVPVDDVLRRTSRHAVPSGVPGPFHTPGRSLASACANCQPGLVDVFSGDDAVHAAVPRLRRALDRIDLPDDGPTRSHAELATEVADMTEHRLQARYAEMACRLPGLIAELARAHADARHGDVRDTARLMTLALRAVDGLAYKFGYLDLSARIIDLMRVSAPAAEDPLLVAAVAYVRTETFFATGDLASASRLLMAAADDLPADLGASAASAAAFGALHMRAAVVAGRGGKPDVAWDHLGEAHRAARQATDGVYFGTAFGPASVRIHELAVAVELGDRPAAVERAAAWHPPADLPAERRSHYYIDLARAQCRLGHHQDAYLGLQTAREVAPQHVREHPQVRRTLTALLRTHGSPDNRLVELAAWARVR